MSSNRPPVVFSSVAEALGDVAAAIQQTGGGVSADVETALFEIADGLDYLGGRRATLERFAIAVLGAVPLAVPPEEAAHHAWTRAIAALAWADEHRAEVDKASRSPATK
jgi:hypothetical protein